MKKSVMAGVAVLVVALGGAAVYGLQSGNQQQPKTQTPTTTKAIHTASKITYSNDGKTVDYDGVKGATALTTLEELTKVETKETTYGKQVLAINGVAADGTSQYWGFYVNGKMADIGAGVYTAKTGDKIEWRLEKL